MSQPPPRQPSIDLGKMIGRLALLVVVLLIVVNIPVTRYGVSLARIMPETSSLIVRDGLVLKGSGPEIYILLLRKRDTLGRLWEPRLHGQMPELPHLDTVTRETNRWLRQSNLV